MATKRKKNDDSLVPFHILIPPDLKRDLEICSKAKGINVSSLARMWLIESVKKEKLDGNI